MLKRIIYMLLAATVLAACEKDYEWQAGEEPQPDATLVYFSSVNPSIVVNGGTDEASFNVVLERSDADGALTVPIVVSQQVGEMQVPTEAHFADGEERTMLVIPYTYQKDMSLTLSIGGGMGNAYAIQDGSLTYACSIARLNMIGRVKYRDDCDFNGVESYISNYEGRNQFVFSNFMGSGVDVTFTVDTSHDGGTFDADDIRSLKGDFVPIGNYYFDGYVWYVYDELLDDCPAWQLPWWDKPIEWLYYWPYTDGYSYSHIDFSNKTYSRFYGLSTYHDSEMEEEPTIHDVYYTISYNN